MKRLILAVLLVATSGFAEESQEILKFKNGVTFNHKTHQVYQKGECKICHGKQIGRIEGFGKDKAHRLCRTCHAMKKAGPASCRDCHKRTSDSF